MLTGDVIQPQPVIEIRNLRTSFRTDAGPVQAVRGVDLSINAHEILCLVGESGSGKSVTAHSVMRLLPRSADIEGGQILFEGEDMLALRDRAVREIQGNRISMVFQEPMTSLNPVLRVGPQVAEVLLRHRKMTRAEAEARVVELFEMVGISEPKARYRAFPSEMSGGMRQRVVIAMALACSPRLIIADEPTTALDVTIQAQVLDLMHGLVRETGTALMLITHDLGVVSEMADRVAVMYAGQIVESAPVEAFFDTPLHPYSAALIRSVPQLDDDVEVGRKLYSIPGTVPNLLRPPTGCAFRDRCDRAMARCATDAPAMREVAPGRQVRCWLHAA